MIRGVKVINHESKAFDFLLNDTMNSGLYIQNIDGLGYPPSSISTSSVFNYGISKYGYTEKQPRNIVITFGVSSNGYYTVEQARRFIYEMFPQDTNLYMEFKSDEANYKITGYVETITPTIFDSKESVQVSVICPNPYFYSGGKTIITSEDAGNNFQFTEWFEQLKKEEGNNGTLSEDGLIFTIPDDSPSHFDIDLKYRSVEIYIPDEYDFSFFNIDLYYYFLKTWDNYPSFDSYSDNIVIDISILDMNGSKVSRVNNDSEILWKAPYKNGKSYYTPNANVGDDHWKMTFGYSDIKYLIGSGTSEESTGSICIGLSRGFIRKISGGEFTIHLDFNINGFDQLKETTNEVRKFQFKCKPILNKTYYFYRDDVYYSPRKIMSVIPESATYSINGGSEYVEHKKPVSKVLNETYVEFTSKISNPTGFKTSVLVEEGFNELWLKTKNGDIQIIDNIKPYSSIYNDSPVSYIPKNQEDYEDSLLVFKSPFVELMAYISPGRAFLEGTAYDIVSSNGTPYPTGYGQLLNDPSFIGYFYITLFADPSEDRGWMASAVLNPDFEDSKTLILAKVIVDPSNSYNLTVVDYRGSAYCPYEGQNVPADSSKVNSFSDMDVVFINDYQNQDIYGIDKKSGDITNLLDASNIYNDFVSVDAGFNKYSVEISGFKKVELSNHYYIKPYTYDTSSNLVKEIPNPDVVNTYSNDDSKGWMLVFGERSYYIEVDVYVTPVSIYDHQVTYVGHLRFDAPEASEEILLPDGEGGSPIGENYYKIPKTGTAYNNYRYYLKVTRSKEKKNVSNEFEEDGYYYVIGIRGNYEGGANSATPPLQVHIKDNPYNDLLRHMYRSLRPKEEGNIPEYSNEIAIFSYTYFLKVDFPGGEVAEPSVVYDYAKIPASLVVEFDEMYSGF